MATSIRDARPIRRARAPQLVWNTALIFASRIGSQILSLAVTVTIARKLGAAGLGDYSVLLSLSYIFQTTAALGLNQLLPREIGRRPAEARRLLDAAVSIALPAAMVFALGLASLGRLLRYTPDLVRALDVAAWSLIPGALALLSEGVFVARGEGNAAAAVPTLEHVFRSAASLAVVLVGGRWTALVGGPLVALGWVILIARGLACGLAMWLLRGRLLSSAGRTAPVALHFLRTLPTFAALYALVAIFLKGDVIVLSRLRSPAEVGVYAAGYRLYDIACWLPSTAATVVFPVLARLRHQGSAAESKLAAAALSALLIAVTPVALGLALGAPGVVALFFGKGFDRTATVLAIMPWAMFGYAIDTLLGHVMLAAERQRDDLRQVGLGVVANLTLNLMLVPFLGAVGAALATLGSSVVVAVLHWRYVDRHLFPVRFESHLVRALPAAMVGAGFLWWTRHASPLWTLPCSAALYFACVWLLRAWPAEGLRLAELREGSEK